MCYNWLLEGTEKSWWFQPVTDQLHFNVTNVWEKMDSTSENVNTVTESLEIYLLHNMIPGCVWKWGLTHKKQV